MWMKKIEKTTLTIAAVITACSAIAGILDRLDQKKRELKAGLEGYSTHQPNSLYEMYFKRSFDFFLSSMAFIILFPVMFIIAILVRITLGSPVLFTQERPGRDEIVFRIFKFRTMTDERNSSGELLPDKKRLTPFGQKLRSTSIDELPELINIMRGEMSIVGPRPLLVKYLSLYNKEQRHRHDVRPGLTGLAQISGRNRISWEEKFRDDIYYVNNITFLTDWMIIIKTILKVLKRDGISSETSVTMEVFKGTKTNVNNV